MVDSVRLSSADKPDKVAQGYASAVKALSVMGIKMALDKPDAGKIGTQITTNKKPAEFKLSSDKDFAYVTVDCGKSRTPLGKMSLNLAQDGEKGVAVLEALVQCKLMSKSDMEKLTKGMKGGPDPKVQANEIRAKLKPLKDALALYTKTSSYDVGKRDKEWYKELGEQCKLERSSENYMFLAAVEKNFSRDKIIAAFIGSKAKFQINIDNKVENDIKGGGSFDTAVDEIKALINKDTIRRLQNRMRDLYAPKIKVLEDELKKLEK